jgi:hypothetical protein
LGFTLILLQFVGEFHNNSIAIVIKQQRHTFANLRSLALKVSAPVTIMISRVILNALLLFITQYWIVIHCTQNKMCY